jgi:hypothetical protein
VAHVIERFARLGICLTLLAAGGILVAPLAAQDTLGEPGVAVTAYPVSVEAAPRPTSRATRTAMPITLDGRLDEAAWQTADSITHFVQSQPAPGMLATEPTVVRILYDDRYLYIGAICYDSEPDHLVVASLERDLPGQSTRDMDIFGVTLDTFLDRRNSFIYLVNPYGTLRDGQTFDNSRSENFIWDSATRVKTRIHDQGWTVEMAIPWTSLRFDLTSDDQAWGLNLLRRVRRKNEDSYWAPLDRRDAVHRMSKAGTLLGLQGIRSGRNLSVKPFVLAGQFSGGSLAAEQKGLEFDGGMDLKYGVTPRLTLDLTYRTDFSQVEVDQEQVNLTRLGLFFPEQRDFFLENSGVFTFGDVMERSYRMGSSLRDFSLFHSRRIGLVNGQPVPIVGGGRLTGRAGPLKLGLLNMQTEAVEGAPAENFAVARVQGNVLPNAGIGVIVVNRQATSGNVEDSYNRNFGLDADLRLFQNLIVNSYLARSDTPGEDGSPVAARLSAAWRDRIWDTSVLLKQVGDGFDPGVGFVRRVGMRQGYATLGMHRRPPVALVQEVNPYIDIDYITDLDGTLETRTGIAGLAVDFSDGGTFNVEYFDRYERLIEPFRVRTDAVIPVGAYGYREASVAYRSNAGRALSGRVELGGGGFFNGTRTSVGLRGLWRPSYRISFNASLDHNDISLPDAHFTADVLGARVKYSHSTTLAGSAFVQYNTAAEQMVTNVRVNFLHAPLSNLFFVYTERRGMGGEGGAGLLERFLTAKLTRTVAFRQPTRRARAGHRPHGRGAGYGTLTSGIRFSGVPGPPGPCPLLPLSPLSVSIKTYAATAPSAAASPYVRVRSRRRSSRSTT